MGLRSMPEGGGCHACCLWPNSQLRLGWKINKINATHRQAALRTGSRPSEAILMGTLKPGKHTSA